MTGDMISFPLEHIRDVPAVKISFCVRHTIEVQSFPGCFVFCNNRSFSCAVRFFRRREHIAPQSCFNRVPGVVSIAYPLKIGGRVVFLITVNVVYLRQMLWIIQKRLCDFTMYFKREFPPVNGYTDTAIALNRSCVQMDALHPLAKGAISGVSPQI